MGKGAVLRDGADATVIATGMMVQMALQAARTLAEEGVSVRVVDMHTIKPLDYELVLKAALETRCIVTAEEHTVIGGLGSAVAEFLAEHCPVPVLRHGVHDEFGRSGKAQAVLEAYGSPRRYCRSGAPGPETEAVTQIRLIALDMDGTLLDDDHATVPARNVAALRRAAERGAAGGHRQPARAWDLLHEVAAQLDMLHYAVLSNGAAVLDVTSGEWLWRKGLPRAQRPAPDRAAAGAGRAV